MDEIVRSLTIDISPARYGLVLAATLIAGVTDVLWFKIPNILTVPLIVTGVLYHAVYPAEKGTLFTLCGAFTGFCLLAPFFAAGGIGAGDVKLLSGIGAWVGAHDVLVVFIVAALLNGIYSAAIIARTTKWSDLPRRVGTAWRQLVQRRVASRDTVEHVAQQDERTRRRRLAPLGAMIAIALVILVIRGLLQTDATVSWRGTGGVFLSTCVL